MQMSEYVWACHGDARLCHSWIYVHIYRGRLWLSQGGLDLSELGCTQNVNRVFQRRAEGNDGVWEGLYTPDMRRSEQVGYRGECMTMISCESSVHN